MSYYKDRTGEKHFSNQGYEVEIIKYFSAINCTIRFNDERNTIREKVAVKEILSGSVKNYYHPEALGVGYMGVGKYTSRVDGIMTKCYTCWNNMLKRSCSTKYKQKHPTYKEVKICKEWHNYQNFAQWFEDKYTEDFELDKDILVKGNKVYSPETCAFIPNEINLLFTKRDFKRGELPIGVRKSGNKFKACIRKEGKEIYINTFKTSQEAFQAYKTVKEQHIKEIAYKWKDKINPRTYIALINYQVEITD